MTFETSNFILQLHGEIIVFLCFCSVIFDIHDWAKALILYFCGVDVPNDIDLNVSIFKADGLFAILFANIYCHIDLLVSNHKSFTVAVYLIKLDVARFGLVGYCVSKHFIVSFVIEWAYLYERVNKLVCLFTFILKFWSCLSLGSSLPLNLHHRPLINRFPIINSNFKKS